MSSSAGLCAPERSKPPAVAANLGAAAQSLPVGFMHLKVAQAIHTVLIELGADPDALVAEASLDPRLFDSGSNLVPFTALGRLMALGADRTRCPYLGLLVGQRTTLT